MSVFKNLQEKLLEYLKSRNGASFIEIVKFLQIDTKNNRNFTNYLNDLKSKGIIAFSKKRNNYFVPKFIGNFDVDLKMTSQGKCFTFVKLSDDFEIKVIIFNNHLNALKNDNVNIDVYQDIYDLTFYFGIQTKINKRKNQFIYAQVDSELNLKLISIDITNFQIHYDRKNLTKNSYAKFKITSIDKNNIYLELDKTLNFIDKPYSDIELLVDMSSIRKEFSDDIINEAKLIPDSIDKNNNNNRIDLTSKLLVTIDGEKTKDFDDAVLVEKIDNNYKLYVSIADVAYYVKENSLIDLEAQSRGCSIYLIDKVIPMLPNKLSTGICSLNPNEDRYALTLEVDMDKNGNILSKKIYPSIINSKYRLTYNQVANKDNDLTIQNDLDLLNMLNIAYELSDIIGNNKIRDGYIDFEIEEPIIELDKETSKTIAIKKRERLSSEILIENFMVFANETVSKMIADLKIPSIYRVHEAPDEEKIQNLNNFINLIFPDQKLTFWFGF